MGAFPPNHNYCPDGWTITNGNACTTTGTNYGNIFNGNVLSTNTYGYSPAYSDVTGRVAVVDFTNSGWSSKGKSAICEQKNWANKYNVQWDGVANYNGC
jgi:hypothetical protein